MLRVQTIKKKGDNGVPFRAPTTPGDRKPVAWTIPGGAGASRKTRRNDARGVRRREGVGLRCAGGEGKDGKGLGEEKRKKEKISRRQ